MGSNRKRVLLTGLAAVAIGVYAEIGLSAEKEPTNTPVTVAVDKGMKWLVSVQGKDGGWGQDGGETSYVRQGERLESNGNDVANTAVAAEALLHTGNTLSKGAYRENLQRAVAFIMQHVEQSPAEGLEVTNSRGTQIQRKLGPYIDTFLSARLLGELDGNMGDTQANARVRQDLQKCVAKIEKNQLQDGSWNIAGAWAPIFGTSLASQSLNMAMAKGVAVKPMAMAKVQEYTQKTASAGGVGSGSGGGVGSGAVGGVLGGIPASTTTTAAVPPRLSAADTVTVAGSGRPVFSASAGLSASSAGVSLYKRAQELEQLSRTDEDRKTNAKQIAEIKTQLSDPRFITGFGSVGGEEFFSYLNISDSLHRAGGAEWERWNTDMKDKVLKMQNEDGTWAGHHCITGRVAVTSAALLILVTDREPAVQLTSATKH
jgi:Squalene-hopene cyclase C-terminal domain/Prenyltransferase and squalene oxidase repeat